MCSRDGNLLNHYIPDRGDIVWLQLNNPIASAAAGKISVVVISSLVYNRKTNLAIVCPITETIKGYPFEIRLPSILPVQGAILSDQVINLDWRARKAELVCKASDSLIKEVVSKIRLIID